MIWPTPLRYKLFNSAVASVAILILYGTVTAVALQEPARLSTGTGQPRQRGDFPAIPYSSRPPRTGDATQPLGQIAAPRERALRVPSMFQQEQMMSSVQLMKRWEPFIKSAARRFTIPASWIREVMHIESGGRTMMAENIRIVSSQGALGLMQLLPGTFAEMSAQYGLGRDPFDPHDNIFAGAAYLRWLRGKYGFPTMFEAYNDGPANFEQRLTKGVPLPVETRSYVSAVTVALGGKPPGLGSAPENAPTAPAAALSIPRPIDLSTYCAFTRPDGTGLVVDCSQVTSVRAPPVEDSAPLAQSIITIGSADERVRESEEVARQLILSHGGHI